ncbi:hypothetical protein MTBPR1_140029 [Candidatus Terasakiella magnetica]|uniref:Uncharacterized protein n=1 Tax=Candidatus Terasakiella magnetica TaxID=1867952 RepID=A0A1C3RF83_9PROT|nr:hypothetical protein [Candidatus Terasakiella magnetica]SCA55911.1 hypothetical protein MTBPR1_140029 [Candidatus Terasakiella magnetica]
MTKETEQVAYYVFDAKKQAMRRIWVPLEAVTETIKAQKALGLLPYNTEANAIEMLLKSTKGKDHRTHTELATDCLNLLAHQNLLDIAVEKFEDHFAIFEVLNLGRRKTAKVQFVPYSLYSPSHDVEGLDDSQQFNPNTILLYRGVRHIINNFIDVGKPTYHERKKHVRKFKKSFGISKQNEFEAKMLQILRASNGPLNHNDHLFLTLLTKLYVQIMGLGKEAYVNRFTHNCVIEIDDTEPANTSFEVRLDYRSPTYKHAQKAA